jgi:alanine racemase
MSFKRFELYRNNNYPADETFRTINAIGGNFRSVNTNQIVINGTTITGNSKNFTANVPTTFSEDTLLGILIKSGLQLCGSSLGTDTVINYSNTFNNQTNEVQFAFLGDKTLSSVPNILNSPEASLFSSLPFCSEEQFLSFITSTVAKQLSRQILQNYFIIPLIAVRNPPSGWGDISSDIKVFDKDHFWTVEIIKKAFGVGSIVTQQAQATLRDVPSGETLTMRKNNNTASPYFPPWSGSLRIGYLVFKLSTWSSYTLEQQNRIQSACQSILLQSYNLTNQDDATEIKRLLNINPLPSWSLEQLRSLETGWRDLLSDYKSVYPNISLIFSAFTNLYSTRETSLQVRDYTRFPAGSATIPIARPIVLRRSWVELDMAALRRNFLRIKQWVSGDGEKEIISMVKANSYGNSATLVTREIDPLGSRYGVANVQEAIALRETCYVDANKIHIFGACAGQDERRSAVLHGFIPSINSFEEAQQFATIVQEVNNNPIVSLLRNTTTSAVLPFKVQWSIDTGMGRTGTWRGSATNDYEELRTFASQIKSLNVSGIEVESVWSHLPGVDADSYDSLNGTRGQLLIWDDLVEKVFKPTFSQSTKYHILNSAGLIRFPQYGYNRVRPGLILYGISPVNGNAVDETDVINQLDDIDVVTQTEPVLSVKSRVTLVRTLEKYRSVSYDRTFVVGCGENGRPSNTPLVVATIGIGYEDGYMRSISRYIVPEPEPTSPPPEAPYVLIRGTKCTLLGRITMDQIMVDVTAISNTIQVGDTVTLIGTDGDETITAGLVAKWAGTISWEVITTFGERMVVEAKNVGSNASVSISPFNPDDELYSKPVSFTSPYETPPEDACDTKGLDLDAWDPYIP